MSWSYTLRPLTVPRDEIRLIIGDTDSLDQLIQDEELDYFIATHGSARAGAPYACESIAARFTRMADETVGQVSVSYAKVSENMLRLAAQIRTRTNITMTGIYAGGISVADKDSQRENDDRVDPFFTRRMHDQPSGIDAPDDRCEDG